MENINVDQLQAEHSEERKKLDIQAYKKFQNALIKASDSDHYAGAVKEWEYFDSYIVDEIDMINDFIDGVTCICKVPIKHVVELRHLTNRDKYIRIGSTCIIYYTMDLEASMKDRLKMILDAHRGSKRHALEYCRVNNLIGKKHIDFVNQQNAHKALRKEIGQMPRMTEKQKTYYDGIMKKAKNLFKNRNSRDMNVYLKTL